MFEFCEEAAACCPEARCLFISMCEETSIVQLCYAGHLMFVGQHARMIGLPPPDLNLLGRDDKQITVCQLLDVTNDHIRIQESWISRGFAPYLDQIVLTPEYKTTI